MESLNRLSWQLFLTPQEHMLMGSTSDSRYSQFYVPKIIQLGIDVESVNKIREFYKTFPALGCYFQDALGNDIEADSVEVILSSLNLQTRETIFDPKSALFKIKKIPEFKLRF
ncbi:MAG: hypothetical protein ACOYT4_03080 [Nanoarchaeota archaeon]